MKGRRGIIMLVAAMVFLMAMASQSWGVSCEWTINKTADQTELELSLGQQFQVNYTLTVTHDYCCYWEGYETCVDVYDSMGYSTTVYAVLSEPLCTPVDHVLTYPGWVGPFNTCGDYWVENTATLEGKCYGDWSDEASWTVLVHVPCTGGCTLTQGYWKTHSSYGPAPYDDAWALVPREAAIIEGADAPFFSSGQTWYQVLWTPPKKGNAYYQLAHQYIAAKLNILNGASSTERVDAALTWAEEFFTGRDPSVKLSDTLRDRARNKANLLDRYNNGDIGPGHCSEEKEIIPE